MVEIMYIHGIPVPIFTPDNLPDLPKGRRVDQEQLFESTEGREEVRERKLKLVRRDDV